MYHHGYIWPQKGIGTCKGSVKEGSHFVFGLECALVNCVEIRTLQVLIL